MLLKRVSLQFSLRETIRCLRIKLLRLSGMSLVSQAWKDYFCSVSCTWAESVPLQSALINTLELFYTYL